MVVMCVDKSVSDAMRSVAVFCLVAITCAGVARCENGDEKLVRIAQGPVKGYKEPEDDVFAFYGIPYATAPTGQHKFKAPLPAPAWLSTLDAIDKNIACPQVVVPDIIGRNSIVQENCLVANVFVPSTDQTNLPVVVYVHGGAFQIGHGLFFSANKILGKKKFIMVTFNYRLGAHGFLCLGTEDAPGNAGMKDQVALLRWVKNNIASFGGNPDDVTLWGSSAGSSSVDLLMISPAAKGLFNKVIPDSGANLAAFSVQTDPIANAKEYLRLLNISIADDVYSLEEFYKTASFPTLFKDAFIGRTDSTFLFSPCVERKTSEEPFLEDSPYNILKSGNYDKVPILYGFANMEGLLRIGYFEEWKNHMNEKFSDFLPPDLKFSDEVEKEAIAKKIKEFYFGDGPIGDHSVLAYIDFFSDIIFVYPTLRAINLHVHAGHNKIYFYEYSYVNENDPADPVSPVVPHTDNVRGANHCAQSAALFDGHGLVRVKEDTLPEDLQSVKEYMRELWINFILTGTPVPEGSPLPAWPPVSEARGAPHMSLGRRPELRGALIERRARFWGEIFEQHYRAPQPPPPPPPRRTDL